MPPIMNRRLRLPALCGVAGVLLAACATAWLSPHERGHPLVGRIVDARTGGAVTRDELERRAAAARWVLLGEAHDNADHHRLQAEVVSALLRAGRAPALAMEQFDREHQLAMDTARSRGEKDPDRIADAGKFDRKGWRWPDYRPLVAIAATRGLPLLAANLSREDARALMKSGRPAPGLAPLAVEDNTLLERDIVEGHCGVRPPQALLGGMVEAQRARDAQMAVALLAAGPGGAALVAGAGHVRRDRGVPAYLPAEERSRTLVIAFLEVEAGVDAPAAGLGALYDLVWYTPRADRTDPCKDLRLPG